MLVELGKYFLWYAPYYRIGFLSTGMHEWHFAIGRFRITKKLKK